MRIAPVPLVVVGEGRCVPGSTRRSRPLPNLRLLGYRADAELASLARHAAVVVVPSLFYEHFCYAAAEALLDARPVVAARIGAIPELVEHEVTGLLVPPGDAHALSEAVVARSRIRRPRAGPRPGAHGCSKPAHPRCMSRA